MTDLAPTFAGLRIAAFESRRAGDMQRLIERYGGQATVSPSLREVPVDDERPAVEFAHRVMTGGIDIAIFLTGVGTEQLMAQVERRVDRRRFLDCLSDIETVARGPKPAKALRELGIPPTIHVPEPNTWREVLEVLERKTTLANANVAVQEYGVSNVSLTAGLEARGAAVFPVKVYRWELPEDLGALRKNIARLAEGGLDAVLFTSAQQAVHLLEVAREEGLEDAVRGGLAEAVIVSIGPTTSETLQELGLTVDFQPSHPKLGHLVTEAALNVPELLERKRRIAARVHSLQLGPPDAKTSAAYHDAPFMKACRGEPTPYTPVWLMRQAGRYMAEYRAVREKVSFLELCRNPELCSEVMCTAVEKLGVDAAIIFSDLLPILEPMGMELEFTPGDGPQIHNPVREASDVHRVLELESTDALHYVFETVTQTRRDLPEEIPLIGFAGAPFTLASYAIEGGSTRNYIHTKTLMMREPDAWHDLMARLARSVVRYLNAQIAAGAQAVQLFDSWVGCLGPSDYQQYVQPHVRTIGEQLAPGVPLIHFGTGNPSLLPLMAEAAGDVIGVDWRIDLADAWQRVGVTRAVQGNLDPLVLLADRATLRQRTLDVLQSAARRPGHIFNLGHGVLPQTPVDNAIALVDIVHEATS